MGRRRPRLGYRCRAAHRIDFSGLRRPGRYSPRHRLLVAELLVVQRGLHPPSRAPAAEARQGLRWLDKVWDQRHRVLYAQVGLGTGSERFGFVGDHDVWRLPEADDALRVRPGDAEFFIKYRPVFRAAPPGVPISPNLAGRVAAAFALGAQVEAAHDRRPALALLRESASVFAMARTTGVGELVTAYPHAYYPEDSWEDDLEFGAVELALAARRLGDRRAAGWPRAATRSFGFAATARPYQHLTGDRADDAFGTAQRDRAPGANAWGTTFVIGEGTVFPPFPSTRWPTRPGASPAAAGCSSAPWSTAPTGRRTSRTSASPTAPGPAPSTAAPLRRLRPPRRALPGRRPRPAQRRAGDRLHLHRHARLRPDGPPLSAIAPAAGTATIACGSRPAC
jgi:Glycosyl hydrolase family 9